MKIGLRTSLCLVLTAFSVQLAAADITYIEDATIDSVSVNGGSDSANAGTTCVRILNLSAICPAGYIAIQNNNKQLIAAAMQAKATGSPIAFYYQSNVGSHHCPGRTFTHCSVINIELK